MFWTVPCFDYKTVIIYAKVPSLQKVKSTITVAGGYDIMTPVRSDDSEDNAMIAMLMHLKIAPIRADN